MLAPSKMGGRSVPKHEASSFLDRPIGEQELPAGRSARRELSKRLEQRWEPARKQDGVIVQKDEELAGGFARTTVYAPEKSQVLGVPDDPESVVGRGQILQPGFGFVIRGVID